MAENNEAPPCPPESEQESKLECVALANRIVEGLLLNIPLYRDISDIEIPHLVEIHCRLLNLNFDEFGPGVVPWKPIDDIILSLRDRFGADQFQHMDSMLIYSREPSHLFCLLQIYETIYHYCTKQGKSFISVPIPNQTVLATPTGIKTPAGPSGQNDNPRSHRPLGLNEAPSSSSSWKTSDTELELDVEVVENETADGEINVEQWEDTSKRHKMRIHIPKIPDTPLSNNQDSTHSKRNTNSDVGVMSPDPKTPPPPPVKSATKSGTELELDVEVVENETADGEINVEQWEDTSKRHQMRIHIPKIPDTPLSNNQDSPHSKRNTNSDVGVMSPDPRIPPPPPPTKSAAKRKQLPIPLAQSSRGSATAAPKSNQPIRPPVHELPARVPATSTPPSYEDILQKYSDMESTPAVSTDTLKGINSDPAAITSQKAKTNYDYFGRPIREKFPYYPYGIIKPRCHGLRPSSAKAPGKRRLSKGRKKRSQEDDCKEFLCNLLGKVLSKATAAIEEELATEEEANEEE